MKNEAFEALVATIMYVSKDLVTKMEVKEMLIKIGCYSGETDFNRNWTKLTVRINDGIIYAFTLRKIKGEEYLNLTIYGTDYEWDRNTLDLPEGFFNSIFCKNLP